MSLNGMIKYSQFTFNHPASTSRNNAIGQHSGILEIISFMSVKHDTEMRAGTQVNLVGACLYILTPTVAFILLMQLVLLQAIFRGKKNTQFTVSCLMQTLFSLNAYSCDVNISGE